MRTAEPTPDLNERERRVLQALVDEHIATAEPVGSKALSALAELGVSSATVRNVLGALSELGLIAQPHTSAGRVPTDRGLRYYVDSLLTLQRPTDQEHDEIRARINEAGAVDEALREASRVLSHLSHQTSLVVIPRPESARIRHVELLRLRDDAVLLIVVTAEGKVQNRLLEWRGPGSPIGDTAPRPEELVALGHKLKELLIDRSLEEGHTTLQRRIEDARTELSAVERRVLVLAERGLAHVDVDAGVHVEGTSHLLEGSSDELGVKRARDLLAFLEEHDRLRTVLGRAVRAPGVQIFIGEENPASPLVEKGVVAAPIGSGALGVLGVIGPRHLDYARVVPLVDLTAQVVARVLSRG